MLPVEVWSLIVSYLSVIDLFNLSVCSKYFYVIAHKNTCLNKKINISKHLISNDLMVYGQVRCFLFVCATRACKKNLVIIFQQLPFYVSKKKKKIKNKKLDETLYDVLSFKIYCHLFHCCHGFSSVNKCVTRFHIENNTISNYLDKEFTFERYFLMIFIEKFIQMKLPYIFITVEFFLSINIVL